MQPLATTRRVLTWLSICPADESCNERQKKAYVAHTLAVLFLNLIGFIGCLALCLKNVSIDFDDGMFALSGSITEFGVIYFLIAANLMRHQIDNIFTSLSTIYKSHENEVAFQYLTRANNTSERMWTIYMAYMKAAISGMVTTCLLSVLYCHLTRGNFNAKCYYRPTGLLLPWNQATNSGYLGEMIVFFPIFYGYLLLIGTPVLLFISLCKHQQEFYEIIKHKVDNSEKCDAKLLCDSIRFHITAKDLFLDSANVYSPFVLVQLICNTVMLTVSVFYIDLQWHHLDFTMATILVGTSIAMSTLLLYCYFGKLATESYEMMSDCMYNDTKWYEQPTESQKRLILAIQNMQKPVYYHGFYAANLDLRTFIKLCNSVFSYYMVIKTLAAK